MLNFSDSIGFFGTRMTECEKSLLLEMQVVNLVFYEHALVGYKEENVQHLFDSSQVGRKHENHCLSSSHILPNCTVSFFNFML